MVGHRLCGPSFDRGEHRLRCVPGDLRHQLGQLRRVRGHVDGAVELVVEPHGAVAVVGGVGIGQLVMDGRKFLQRSSVMFTAARAASSPPT